MIMSVSGEGTEQMKAKNDLDEDAVVRRPNFNGQKQHVCALLVQFPPLPPTFTTFMRANQILSTVINYLPVRSQSVRIRYFNTSVYYQQIHDISDVSDTKTSANVNITKNQVYIKNSPSLYCKRRWEVGVLWFGK